MLRDDIAKYTELTGEDGAHIPIIKLGAFLDGYERGSEEVNKVLDKIRAEIENLTNGDTPERIWNVDVLEIIDKYKAESEVEE